MSEPFARIFVLLMLVQFFAALVIGEGLVFWGATVGLFATFATWAAWEYLHRNDHPEEES